MAERGADIASGWSAQQVREAERPLLAAGVPLMARAAAGLADEVLRVLAARGAGAGRLLVLVGSGNNGGDALYAAATLLARGSSAVVARLGTGVHGPGLRAAERAGARVLPPDATPGLLAAEASAADVVLDGVLGIGARGGLRPPARQAVARLLEEARGRAAVVAVDLPSGVGPDDGRAHPPVLRADRTVAFGAMKAGLLVDPGRALAGRVRLVDIGLGPQLAGRRPLRPAGL
ncbi:NAD(P)H-hydrate epimerase [Amnibacterium setariae]|uniref:NAD(P)H-hydrate epimerase n=1 Tax=Amnibacterium setariae TaxID=2306585 RepID=A0A3A1TTQ8_9MICO|nr:NAD(P)H-hydrate epimerase [Amnibacterium setariae]RIX27613.1 NAD(P)H-hydrate epimerase [Amnibacterium setariae]